MIVQERYTMNGRDFIRTYSDDDRYVVGGEPYGEYSEANDPADLDRTYVEGRRMTEGEIVIQAEEVMDILLGVTE